MRVQYTHIKRWDTFTNCEPPPVTKGKDWENQLIGPWVLCWNTEPIGR